MLAQFRPQLVSPSTKPPSHKKILQKENKRLSTLPSTPPQVNHADFLGTFAWGYNRGREITDGINFINFETPKLIVGTGVEKQGEAFFLK